MTKANIAWRGTGAPAAGYEGCCHMQHGEPFLQDKFLDILWPEFPCLLAYAYFMQLNPSGRELGKRLPLEFSVKRGLAAGLTCTAKYGV